MSAIIPYLQPGAITNAQSDITDLQALSGMPDNSLNLGTFTGTTIPDSQTSKQALQALETEVELRDSDIIQSKVGTGPGYRFDGTDDFVQTSFNLAGWDDLTLCFDFVHNANTGTLGFGTDYGSVSDFGYHWTITNGKFFIEFTDGTTTNRNRFESDLTLEVGRRYNAVIVREDGLLDIYLNGKKIPSTLTLVGSGYSGPIHSGSNNLTIGKLGTSNSSWFNGTIFNYSLFNRAITPAEVALVSRGQNPGFADFGADGSASYTSDFSAGVDGFTINSGLTALTDSDGVSDGTTSYDDVLEIETNTGNSSHAAIKLSSLTPYKRYRISGKYYVPSANTTSVGVRFTTSLGFQLIHSGTVTGEWTDFDVEFLNRGAGGFMVLHQNSSEVISFTGVAGEKVYVRDIIFTPIGEVLRLTGNGAAPTIWADESGNGYNGTVTGATLIGQRTLHADSFVSLTNLPTSSAGLATGQVWNDSGTLKIV